MVQPVNENNTIYNTSLNQNAKPTMNTNDSVISNIGVSTLNINHELVNLNNQRNMIVWKLKEYKYKSEDTKSLFSGIYSFALSIFKFYYSGKLAKIENEINKINMSQDVNKK